MKPNDNIGTTIDVALVNGCLSVGDTIVIAGQETPIVTRIRGLLIPESNQELRVTVNRLNEYEKSLFSMKFSFRINIEPMKKSKVHVGSKFWLKIWTNPWLVFHYLLFEMKMKSIILKMKLKSC